MNRLLCFSIAKKRIAFGRNSKPLATALLGIQLAALFLVTGCAITGSREQRLVSKPNMLFPDAGAFTYQTRLNMQTEPGSVASGGAQPAGCTACK